MVNRARLTTTAQFYDKDNQEGLTLIGTEVEPPPKNTWILWMDIPDWSRSLLKCHIKKIEENLELL